jgi:hypothetical protein
MIQGFFSFGLSVLILESTPLNEPELHYQKKNKAMKSLKRKIKL